MATEVHVEGYYGRNDVAVDLPRLRSRPIPLAEGAIHRLPKSVYQ